MAIVTAFAVILALNAPTTYRPNAHREKRDQCSHIVAGLTH